MFRNLKFLQDLFEFFKKSLETSLKRLIYL